MHERERAKHANADVNVRAGPEAFSGQFQYSFRRPFQDSFRTVSGAQVGNSNWINSTHLPQPHPRHACLPACRCVCGVR